MLPSVQGLEAAIMRWVGVASVLAGLAVGVGCGEGPDSSAPRLRVVNAGEAVIEELTVLFPEDRVYFGDVAPGATSTYREVPNGVYRYAAYNLEIDGALVTQPVIDWVGEVPLQGEAFTYTLEVNPVGSPFEVVTLIDVTRDN